MPGTKPSAIPPRTSRIGYGIAQHRREHEQRGDRHEEAEQDQLLSVRELHQDEISERRARTRRPQRRAPPATRCWYAAVRSSAALARIRHEPRLDEHDRNVRPVEAGQVAALDDAEVRARPSSARAVAGRSRPRACSRRRRRPSSRGGGPARASRCPAELGFDRAVGVDAQHQRGAADVAEAGLARGCRPGSRRRRGSSRRGSRGRAGARASGGRSRAPPAPRPARRRRP